MSDHSKPTLSSTYANFLSEMSARVDDAVKQARSDTVTFTNPPVGAIRWNSAGSKWENNTGTVGTPVWTALATTYAINAATASAWATGRTLSITTDGTGTSAAFDGSGNISVALTLATVNSNVGSFGSASVVPILTVNAKGLVTAVSTATLYSGAVSWTGNKIGAAYGGTNWDSSAATGLAKIAAGVWSAGAAGTDYVAPGGALGTPSSGNLSNCSGIPAGSVALSSRTSNTILAAGDKGGFIDITSGTFTQTFTAAATLGNGWWCYLRNSGTGVVTLDPNASEMIDGLTSYPMYTGEVRLVQCTGSAFITVLVVGGMATFSAGGTFIMPPGTKNATVVAYGAGGNGGAGASGTYNGTLPSGGGAGGGGERVELNIASLAAGTSVTVTCGAAPGGYTTFGTLLKAWGGGNGAAGVTGGGQSAPGAGGGGQTGGNASASTAGISYGATGYNGQSTWQGSSFTGGSFGGWGYPGTATNSQHGADSYLGGAGGGGGGGENSGQTPNVGGNGGASKISPSSSNNTVRGSGAAGGTATYGSFSNPGTAGAAGGVDAGGGGGGGGAGSSTVGITAGAGGNGGFPAGGGGGGGANGASGPGGAGGTGAGGAVYVRMS